MTKNSIKHGRSFHIRTIKLIRKWLKPCLKAIRGINL